MRKIMKIMNRAHNFIVGGFIFLGLLGFCYAESRPVLAGVTMPGPGAFFSQAVYYTSASCAGTSANFVSTRSALVYSFIVVSTGTSDSKIELFDARISTADQRRILPAIKSNVERQLFLEVGVSSGIAVIVSTGTLTFGDNPCWACIYSER